MVIAVKEYEPTLQLRVKKACDGQGTPLDS
jgi:hypothetical protein